MNPLCIAFLSGKLQNSLAASSYNRVSFLTRCVGLMLGGPGRPSTWQGGVQPREGKAVTCAFTVRAIPLKKSGVGGLCWLIRPLP